MPSEFMSPVIGLAFVAVLVLATEILIQARRDED